MPRSCLPATRIGSPRWRAGGLCLAAAGARGSTVPIDRPLGTAPPSNPDPPAMHSAVPRSLPRARHTPGAVALPGTVEPRLKLDALRISVMVILLLSIGRMQESLPFLMPLRLGLVCTAVGIAFAVTHRHTLAHGALLSRWPARVVVAIAVLACIGAPFGLSLGGSAAYMMDRFSKVIIFILLLMVAIRGTQDLRWYVWGFVIAAAYICYLSIFVIDVTSYYGSEVARLDGDALGAYDANDIGVILTMAIPLTLLTMQTSGRKGMLFSVAVLAAIGATTAISGSRGGFLGLVAVGGALLVYLSHISIAKRMGAVAVILGALVMVAPPGYWAQMRTIVDPEADYNRTAEDGRIQVWKRGVGYAFQYPVFGVGLGNFSRAEGTISDKARDHVEGTGLRYTAAHNSFVQIGAELGPVGLALYGALVIGGIGAMRRMRRRLPREWLHGDRDQRFLYLMTIYLPVSFIAFSVTGFFVSFAYSAPVYILAAFVTGMYVSVERRISAEYALANALEPQVVEPPVPRWVQRARRA